MDEFMQEVEEDLKREKLEAFWKSYGKYIIALVLSIIVGVALWTFYKHNRAETQMAFSAQYSSALAQVQEGKLEEAKKSFQTLSLEKGNVYGNLAQLQLGAIAAKEGKTEDMLKAYDEVSQDKRGEIIFRDWAVVLKSLALMDTQPEQAKLGLTDSLEKGSGPIRVFVSELLSWAHWKLGQSNEALDGFSSLESRQNIPHGILLRSHVMSQALQGKK